MVLILWRNSLRIITWFGSIDLSENGEVQSCDLIEKDPQVLAYHMLNLDTNANLLSNGLDLRQLAIECDFVKWEEDYDILLREVCIKVVKNKISTDQSDDKRIVQVIEAIDDIDKASNELSERLSEWYGFYFPELNLNTEDMAYFISKYGSKSNIPEDHKLFSLASSSIGSELSLLDEDLIRNFATSLCGLYDTRKHLEEYIMNNMNVLAPNLTDITGALLGARLISLAGSLQKLASFPSSTIQVIGAHNALFKHLRTNTPSPKHGVIFNHPLIKGAPKWQRGKIARILAAKISFAVRVDVYKGEFNPLIKASLDDKIENIKKTFAEPPIKKGRVNKKHSNKKKTNYRSKK